MKNVFLIMLVIGVLSVAADAEILYKDDFSGGATTLLGTTPDITMGGNVWCNSPLDAGVDLEDGYQADGTVPGAGLTGDDDSAWLPFVPEQGYIYTVSADVDVTGGSNRWMLFGFNTANLSAGLSTALGTIRQDIPGALYAATGLGNTNNIMMSGITETVNLKIVLDCTNADSLLWTTSHYVNDVAVTDGVNTAVDRTAAAGYSGIAYVGFCRIKGTAGTIDNFELSRVVPEPATLALLSLGGLLICRKRK